MLATVEKIDLLENALNELSVGIILLNDNRTIFSNKMAKQLLLGFAEFETNPINFLNNILSENIILSNDGKWLKEDLRLTDNNGIERYVSIEISKISNSITILIVDVTKQNIRGMIDELTGIGNRTKYEHTIKELTSTQTFPISIIEGDINGLKLTNDLFGHVVGDSLITETSKILSGCVRTRTDTLCRWGGDEFVIILPGAEERIAEDVCKRITFNCFKNSHEPISPSLSLGYAVTEYKGESLADVLERAESMMYKNKLINAAKERMNILKMLRIKLSEYSTETLNHSERLGRIMKSFGIFLGMSVNEIESLKELSYYHDIGMAALPRDLLLKKGKYTKDEMKVMQTHVQSGYTAVKAVPEYINLAIPILHHHECWNGSGYPANLKGEEIDPLARILRIADSFEVMTSYREYRKTKTEKEALEDLRINSGILYEPILVNKFISMVLSDIERDW